MKKLAIITTHPIQYNAPIFALLTARGKVQVKVFYTWGESVLDNKYDPGFDKNISWDIPLLNGYEYSFIKNISADPGSHHFKGINNQTLINDIEKWKADTILVYGWAFKSHLKAMRYFHGRIPVFFRGDSTTLGKKQNLKFVARKYFLRWVYRHVDKAFYVGTYNKRYYLQNGLKEHQLIFAPHAVDNERFADERGIFQMQANEWRKKLGINPNDLVLVYAGKLEPIKNLGWLIETIRQLNELPVKILLVGNGPLEKELKEMASGDSRFIFIDFQNQQQMPVVYRLGSVFILCSHSETWGLSINEAMASGRAILASETFGCISDLVKNSVNGYVFSLMNPEDLIHKIRILAGDGALAKRMGAESLKIIYDWNFEKVCKAIENEIISDKIKKFNN